VVCAVALLRVVEELREGFEDLERDKVPRNTAEVLEAEQEDQTAAHHGTFHLAASVCLSRDLLHELRDVVLAAMHSFVLFDQVEEELGRSKVDRELRHSRVSFNVRTCFT